jgi:hypothetical protein
MVVAGLLLASCTAWMLEKVAREDEGVNAFRLFDRQGT